MERVPYQLLYVKIQKYIMCPWNNFHIYGNSLYFLKVRVYCWIHLHITLVHLQCVLSGTLRLYFTYAAPNPRSAQIPVQWVICMLEVWKHPLSCLYSFLRYFTVTRAKILPMHEGTKYFSEYFGCVRNNLGDLTSLSNQSSIHVGLCF